MRSPVPRPIAEAVIGVILVSLIVLFDPDLYTVLAYVGSVMTIVYMSYRMLLKEIEDEVYRVFEDKLKKEVEDQVIVVYEKKLKKDIEELIRLYCSRGKT